MVAIIPNFMPLCVLLGSDIPLTSGVEGIDENHVISWLRDGEEITRGEETLADDHCSERLVHQVQPNGMVTLNIRDAQLSDGGTYSIRVYERRQDGTLQQIAQEEVAFVNVGEYNDENPRMDIVLENRQLNDGHGYV
ncbi:uncharacterized protein LOC117119602 [Anneissia japonica]|uniref:uncharacterized protein LOC117119602 n=1 Tax=Anneissia japonica TaxID=1529436 RepID=UPI0014255C47|nr:uncharacterized protein LOC117119602 [Anneissia japonica]